MTSSFAEPPWPRWTALELLGSVCPLPTVALLLSTAQAAPAAATEVEPHDRAVRVVAGATLKADQRTTWDTLVGYERLQFEALLDEIARRAAQHAAAGSRPIEAC